MSRVKASVKSLWFYGESFFYIIFAEEGAKENQSC